MTEGWAGDTGTLQDRKERSWFGFSMESLIGPCFSFGSVRYSIGPCFSFGSRLQVPECADEEKDGHDDGIGDDGRRAEKGCEAGTPQNRKEGAGRMKE
jgi:hypothetical protein